MTKRMLVQDDAVSPPQQSFALPADAGAGLPANWTADALGNVVIAPSDEPASNLGNVHIVASTGSQDALTITDPSAPDGFNLGIDQFGYIQGRGAALTSGADVATPLLVTGSSGPSDYDLADIYNTSIPRGIFVKRSGHLVLYNANVAPIDDDIPTNGLAFWFDATNGAAKLMVKAKQADGTVRTAAIALT